MLAVQVYLYIRGTAPLHLPITVLADPRYSYRFYTDLGRCRRQCVHARIYVEDYDHGCDLFMTRCSFHGGCGIGFSALHELARRRGSLADAKKG